MKNKDRIKKNRRYERISKYYDTNTMQGMYSVIMVDLIMVILPVLGIVYAINSDTIQYVLFAVCIATILLNFVAHCVSIKAHHVQVSWSEEAMGNLNGAGKENKHEDAGIWDKLLTLFNYLSYIFFIGSLIAFTMTVIT